MNELQKTLDEASKKLSELGNSEFCQWVSYFFEAVESDSKFGGERLEFMRSLLRNRFHSGRW